MSDQPLTFDLGQNRGETSVHCRRGRISAGECHSLVTGNYSGFVVDFNFTVLEGARIDLKAILYPHLHSVKVWIFQ